MQPDAETVTVREGEEATRSARMSWLPAAGVPLIYSLLGALVGVAIFALVFKPAGEIAVVDVLQIMNTFDAQTVDAIKKGDVEAMKTASEIRARKGAELESLLAQVALDKGVVIVQKQAVLGGTAPDLTQEIVALMEKR